MFCVFNVTDGIPAWPDPFPSHAAARSFCHEFRKRYRAQGYYLTADGFRIDPSEVELEIVPEAA